VPTRTNDGNQKPPFRKEWGLSGGLESELRPCWSPRSRYSKVLMSAPPLDYDSWGTFGTYLPFTVTAMSELVPSDSVTVSVAAPGLIPFAAG